MYTPFPRKVNRWLGMILMGLGFFMATPPGFIPDDFINVFAAGLLHRFLGVSMEIGLVMAYTIVAWGLIFLGALIYPYNTTRLLNGRYHALKNILYKTFTKPTWFLGFLIGLVIVWYMFTAYSEYILTAGGLI